MFRTWNHLAWRRAARASRHFCLSKTSAGSFTKPEVTSKNEFQVSTWWWGTGVWPGQPGLQTTNTLPHIPTCVCMTTNSFWWLVSERMNVSDCYWHELCFTSNNSRTELTWIDWKPAPLYQVIPLRKVQRMVTFSAVRWQAWVRRRCWDLIKQGMAAVGVAKFLGCEKTLVKNPSEPLDPNEPLKTEYALCWRTVWSLSSTLHTLHKVLAYPRPHTHVCTYKHGYVLRGVLQHSRIRQPHTANRFWPAFRPSSKHSSPGTAMESSRPH